MGGTGKTPCVLRLAELLRDGGRKPGILTRGYGRISPVDHMALAAGATVRTAETGDEPQIFLRSRVAPVGIGADRFQTGSRLAELFDTDVVVLDDGFQHVRLARNFDLVLIDALNPFGGGEVFPVGRLREPPQGLARADAVVASRASKPRIWCRPSNARCVNGIRVCRFCGRGSSRNPGSSIAPGGASRWRSSAWRSPACFAVWGIR